MRLLPKGGWQYALLLVALFGIASVAVHETIGFVNEHLPPLQQRLATLLIWTVTLGFMLIAGSFGLWAIRFSAEAESLRRVSHVVDGMDYFSDGMLAIDRKGRVTGSNPAAGSAALVPLTPGARLVDAFPCLSGEDMGQLLDRSQPNELERDLVTEKSTRTLRFRSQPSEGLTLVVLSDVTAQHLQSLRSRHAARLQLLGHLAQGIAHDFSDILCSISGHLSLLERTVAGSSGQTASKDAISEAVERGSALAGHLQELSRLPVSGPATDMTDTHVCAAADMLRDRFLDTWQVATDTDELPTVPLTGAQLEQIIVNISLLAADGLRVPGVLSIRARNPSPAPPFDVGERYAAVIVISAKPYPEDASSDAFVPQPSEAGVIFSVLRSMIEAFDGKLERLVSHDSAPAFRVILPHALPDEQQHSPTRLAADLGSYIARWTVLLAAGRKHGSDIERHMRDLGVTVCRATDIVSALARLDDEEHLDAAIVQRDLLQHEAAGVLRAVLRLRPSAGIVVLSDDPDREPEDLQENVVFVSEHAPPEEILLAMVKSKSLAGERERRLSAT